MQNLKRKVVAITGASGGIGEATAFELAERGVNVVLGARSTQELQRIVASIKSNGGNAVYTATDITKRNDLAALARIALERYRKLDAIVNNAGVARISRIDEFITRKAVNNGIVSSLDRDLSGYMQDGNSATDGLPSVKGICARLNVSPRYLSDMMRSLTGLNTQQYI